MRRPKPELTAFRQALLSMRARLKVDQVVMAIRLGTSQRTLSDWENGYSAPSSKERLHFLYTVEQVAPEWTETFAGLFGLASHPAITSLFEDEKPEDAPTVVQVAPPPPPPPAPPPPPPPPPPPTPAELRAALDAVVREAADVVDMRASDLRRGVQIVLEAMAQKGIATEDALRAFAVAARGKGRGA